MPSVQELNWGQFFVDSGLAAIKACRHLQRTR